MTKVAVIRQLHAGNFDDLADQSPSVRFSPQKFALVVCKACAYSTLGRCHEAQASAVLASSLRVTRDHDVVGFERFDFDPLVALTKDEALEMETIRAS